jgi:hypothetical protein
MGSPYTLCAQWCIGAVAEWVDYHSYNGETALFFEEGDKHESDLDEFIKILRANRICREAIRCTSHGFISKGKARGVEAADLLVWEWGQEQAKMIGAKTGSRRRSLINLLSVKHVHCHWTQQHLRAYVANAEAWLKG